MPRKPKLREKPPCPRCGRPVDWFERAKRGNRVYIIAVHYLGYTKLPGGRVRARVEKCYLGPEGGYVYVTKTHGKEGLTLRGAQDGERVIAYLEAIIGYFEKPNLKLPQHLLRNLADKLRLLADKLEKLSEIDIEGGIGESSEKEGYTRGISADAEGSPG